MKRPSAAFLVLSFGLALPAPLLAQEAGSQPAPAPSQPARPPPAPAPAKEAPADEGDLGDIAPARPGFSEPPGVVGRGVVQLEAGYTLENDRIGNTLTSASSLPGATVRV